ncbi:DUF7674 family protein [Rhizobium halophytocola]|uniref:DUF7674 domain-containing protein n=1 Tax=Rhizobium halophytocola TaxID=735519 RepID=A0ABS4E3A7_9HYPH|nr:hypothetical protein [Rhizobium halophytocola]MBP1852403.1 hypothetical protein [Rhizobium halophytocola]
MSEWRRRALEILPEHGRMIADAWSPMALWIALRHAFSDAAAACRIEEARRILAYCRDCLTASSGDVRTAAVCGFIEHLVDNPAVRYVLPGLVTAGDIAAWRPLMRYHADAELIDRLERDCRLQRKRR